MAAYGAAAVPHAESASRFLTRPVRIAAVRWRLPVDASTETSHYTGTPKEDV